MLSKIIYGKRGTDFDKFLFPFVRKALCTGSREDGCTCYSCTLPLRSHPDLMILDKESYLVEDINAVVSYAESAPMISEKRVVLLKGLSSVTEISQNKLLKELEDNKSFVLIASSDSEKNSVLPTIRSRTEGILATPESREEFFQKITVEEDKELLYDMTGGYAGLVAEMQGQIEIYKAVQSAFCSRDKGKLLEALHLVIDKDPECYFEKYPSYLSQLFDFMGKLALAGDDLNYVVSLLKVINKEKSTSLSGGYARVNFFTSIANIGAAL